MLSLCLNSHVLEFQHHICSKTMIPLYFYSWYYVFSKNSFLNLVKAQLFGPIIVDLSEHLSLSLQRQDCWGHNVLESNYKPMLYTPHRYRAMGVRSFALPVSLQEIPLIKSTSLALTR
jgi:hypothetical protein